MARVMLAWELGAGHGHAMPLAQLAEVLLERGHEVDLVWKDLSVCADVLRVGLDHPRLRVWQAPIWLRSPAGLPDAASYPELLLRAGFGDPRRLLACARAWRQLFDQARPDLLVADYSPTAMLAARDSPLRVASFGNGFFIPPARSPMPVFRDWEPIDASRIAESEARVLAGCNAVLDALGKAPLGAVHQLFEVDEHFLLGWPELDHLRPWRAGEPLLSWGWPTVPSAGAAPSWPAGRRGPRLFAYLWRNHPASDALLAVLRNGPWSSLVHLAGARDDEVAQLGSEAMAVVNRLVDLRAALAGAELMISHAGSGTLYAALQAGVPALLLPMQAEQLLLATRLSATGAGVVLWPGEVEAAAARAIAAMLGSPGFAGAARALAGRHGDAADVLPRIAARCEALSDRAR